MKDTSCINFDCIFIPCRFLSTPSKKTKFVGRSIASLLCCWAVGAVKVGQKISLFLSLYAFPYV